MLTVTVLLLVLAVSIRSSEAESNYALKTEAGSSNGYFQNKETQATGLNQWEATIRTCSDSDRTGEFLMQLNNVFPPFRVMCFHSNATAASEKWLVIQQRIDGSVNFFRNWANYRDGFGELDGEFWLGLDKIHQVTAMAPYELLVELADFDGEARYARYSRFAIDNEERRFALRELGNYAGTAGDALRSHVGTMFSTYDNDNDLAEATNCPIAYFGAWWYHSCVLTEGGSSLNGKHENSEADNRILWNTFVINGPRFAKLTYTRMMLRLIE